MRIECIDIGLTVWGHFESREMARPADAVSIHTVSWDNLNIVSLRKLGPPDADDKEIYVIDRTDNTIDRTELEAAYRPADRNAIHFVKGLSLGYINSRQLGRPASTDSYGHESAVFGEV